MHIFVSKTFSNITNLGQELTLFHLQSLLQRQTHWDCYIHHHFQIYSLTVASHYFQPSSRLYLNHLSCSVNSWNLRKQTMSFGYFEYKNIREKNGRTTKDMEHKNIKHEMSKLKIMFSYSLDGEQISCQSCLTMNFFVSCCCGQHLATGRHKTYYYDPKHLSDLTCLWSISNLFQEVQTQTTAAYCKIL